MPEHLPRVRTTLLPPEVERDGLDALEPVGSDTRDVIERRRAPVVVVEEDPGRNGNCSSNGVSTNAPLGNIFSTVCP